MRTSDRVLYAAIAVSLLTVLRAQFDGGDVIADPGYSVYGDTGPYPTGDEPLPGWGPGSAGNFSGGAASGGGFPANIWTPNPPSNPFGNLANPFAGPDTPDPTVRGSYTPNQSPSDSPPSLTRPSYNPDSGIPDWARNLGSNVSIDDSTRVQQLFQERSDLQKEVSKDPVGDLATYLHDMIPGGGDDAPEVPLAEERHQQRVRINEINQQLQGIFDRNNLIASPYADESQPPQANTPGPAANDNGHFSVGASDSTPRGSWNGPDKPFDWQSGWQNRFQDSLTPLDYQSMGGGQGGPADPGGIDFRSVRWTYLSEDSFRKPGAWNARSFACGMQAIRSRGGMKVAFPRASRLISDAFFVFLTVPDRDLWVNLHPAEPDRIISASLGRTDVGRIMLEADFQLKRDAGMLMRAEPFAAEEHALAQQVARRFGFAAAPLRWGSTGRVEISSATSRVFARETKTGVFIEGVGLDVVFEQKGFYVAAGGSHAPIEISPDEWRQFVRLTQARIRPGLILRVNRAPEYEALRQIFSARVLTDWYKRTHSRDGALAPLIDQARLDGFASAAPFNPREFWEKFRRDYERGTTRGYGGVSFGRMPHFEQLPGGSGAGAVLLAEALASPAGSWRRGVFRTGKVFLAVKRPSAAAMALRWAIPIGLGFILLMTLLRRWTTATRNLA